MQKLVEKILEEFSAEKFSIKVVVLDGNGGTDRDHPHSVLSFLSTYLENSPC